MSIRCTVTANVTKRCPFVNEVDVGTVELTFDGDAPELHGLAKLLAEMHGLQISHEDYTRALAAWTGAVRAVTTWSTAGLAVLVDSGPVEGTE